MDNIRWLHENWSQAVRTGPFFIVDSRRELAAGAACTCSMVLKIHDETVFRADLRERTVDVFHGGDWQKVLLECVTESRYYLNNKERVDKHRIIGIEARAIGTTYEELVTPAGDEEQVDKAFQRELDRAERMRNGSDT